MNPTPTHPPLPIEQNPLNATAVCLLKRQLPLTGSEEEQELSVREERARAAGSQQGQAPAIQG